MAQLFLTLKKKPMEREHLFKVYYDGKYIKMVTAHTKFQAVELVYSRQIDEYPIRAKIKAKKIW